MAETTDLVGTAAAAIRLHFPEFRDAPAREWQHFVAVLTLRQFGKGEFLQRQGTPADRLFFLVSGLVCLRHQRDGEAINLGFDRENRFVAAYASVLTGEPATFGIVALEPCIAVQLLAADLRGLYERHPCWDRIGRLLAERSFLSKSKKEDELRSYSPAERYQRIADERPWLIVRIPQYELARFLGVAPETLSRIRARGS